MIKAVVIDNYDSFTYNLVHYLEELGAEVTVLRNDEFELDDLNIFDKILLSPGPGLPEEAGLLKSVIQRYAASKSILGVCLGHQAIGEVFGGKLKNLNTVFHGVATPISIVADDSLFEGLPTDFYVGRYHSWVIDIIHFPTELEITAIDENGEIMALHHKVFDVKGIQFHPESILTPHGKSIIKNWLKN